MKLLIAATLLVGLATPALAAEWYILKDPKTNECSIREAKPTPEMQVDGKAYATRDEAKTAAKASGACGKK